VVDYGVGNLYSLTCSLRRLGAEAMVTREEGALRRASRVILPGVGAFADCMRGLRAAPGLLDALNETVIQKAKPFLGICVGMQLMARDGREFGVHRGLGWIDGEVVAMTPADPGLKIPHMGWNEIVALKDHPVFSSIGKGAHAYFVHSFELKPEKRDQLLATTDYGGPVTAAVGRANMVGTQFHPEKSQAVGLRLLSNFLNWTP
jgi:glutamine amidotransferase